MTLLFDLLRFIDRYVCQGRSLSPSYWKTAHRFLKKPITYKIRNYREIEGWLSPNEASALFLLSRLLPPRKTILEIGCWKGKSTYCLAAGLRKGGLVITIDPFDGSGEAESSEIYKDKMGKVPVLDQFSDNMKKFGVSTRIKPLVGLSNQFVEQFQEIDLLFIDGNHSIEGCDFDFSEYSPFLVSGGFLAFHDFDESREELGATWVVNNRVLKSGQFAFWGKFDSLWVCQKL